MPYIFDFMEFFVSTPRQESIKGTSKLMQQNGLESCRPYGDHMIRRLRSCFAAFAFNTSFLLSLQNRQYALPETSAWPKTKTKIRHSVLFLKKASFPNQRDILSFPFPNHSTICFLPNDDAEQLVCSTEEQFAGKTKTQPVHFQTLFIMSMLKFTAEISVEHTLMVMMMAFSSLARILGECSTIPRLRFFYIFFFK